MPPQRGQHRTAAAGASARGRTRLVVLLRRAGLAGGRAVDGDRHAIVGVGGGQVGAEGVHAVQLDGAGLGRVIVVDAPAAGDGGGAEAVDVDAGVAGRRAAAVVGAGQLEVAGRATERADDAVEVDVERPGGPVGGDRAVERDRRLVAVGDLQVVELVAGLLLAVLDVVSHHDAAIDARPAAAAVAGDRGDVAARLDGGAGDAGLARGADQDADRLHGGEGV